MGSLLQIKECTRGSLSEDSKVFSRCDVLLGSVQREVSRVCGQLRSLCCQGVLSPAVCLTVPSAVFSLPQVTSWFEHCAGLELLGGLWPRPCGRCSGWLSLLQVVMWLLCQWSHKVWGSDKQCSGPGWSFMLGPQRDTLAVCPRPHAT